MCDEEGEDTVLQKDFICIKNFRILPIVFLFWLLSNPVNYFSKDLINAIFFFLTEILSSIHNSSSDLSCTSDTNTVYERIRLEKITFAHRAVSVSTDPSGCNFAILQSDPKTRYVVCVNFHFYVE